MERLTNHFNHCDFIGCGWLEENVCRVFGTDTEKCHRKSVYEKLREYEDAEEQGLLIRLPVEEGTLVYKLRFYYECKHEYNCPLDYDGDKCYDDKECEFEYKVFKIKEVPFNWKMSRNFGKTVFLTKEEAEQALAKMEKENG